MLVERARELSSQQVAFEGRLQEVSFNAILAVEKEKTRSWEWAQTTVEAIETEARLVLHMYTAHPR